MGQASASTWVIGLGLGADESGPLELGAWLSEVTGAQLHAIHVAETPSLPGWARDDMRAGLEALLRQRIAACGAEAIVATSEVVFGRSADRALVEAAASHGAGLVVGRRARKDDRSVVRLGRVTRRVLRHLPGPVAVAPPDLQREAIGLGPVVLALDPIDEATDAVDLARGLARETSRNLVVAHVFDPASQIVEVALPAHDAVRLRQMMHAEAEAELARTLERYGLGDKAPVTAEGSAAEELLRIAEDADACALVCGSRRLSLTERIFEGSVSSALAGVSRMPVFVSPSGHSMRA